MASAAFTHDLHFVTTAGQPLQALLRLHGEVDCLAADELRRTLQQVSTTDQGATVVVDLDGVTFINCVGLSPMLMAKNQLGERLHFRGLPRCVRRLLSLTYLTAWMDPSASDERPDEAALDAYSGEQAEPCHASSARRDGAFVAEAVQLLGRPRRTNSVDAVPTEGLA